MLEGTFRDKTQRDQLIQGSFPERARHEAGLQGTFKERQAGELEKIGAGQKGRMMSAFKVTDGNDFRVSAGVAGRGQISAD